MAKAKLKFTKVTEYIAAGSMECGYYCLSSNVKETDKGVGFKAVNYNSYGKPYDCVVWFPKSQVQKVENDFYEHGSEFMWIVPAWLYRAKSDEGFEF